MARITVEDCLVKIPNRFQLVLAATYRARMLTQGHAAKIETKNKPGVTALREIAGEKGCTVAQVALAWLLHQPVVTSVIIGAKRPDQLADNLGAVDVELSRADLDKLDAATALPREYPGWMIERQSGLRPAQAKRTVAVTG